MFERYFKIIYLIKRRKYKLILDNNSVRTSFLIYLLFPSLSLPMSLLHPFCLSLSFSAFFLDFEILIWIKNCCVLLWSNEKNQGQVSQSGERVCLGNSGREDPATSLTDNICILPIIWIIACKSGFSMALESWPQCVFIVSSCPASIVYDWIA